MRRCDAETTLTLAEYWAMRSLDDYDRSDYAAAEESARRSISLKEGIYGTDSPMLLNDPSNLYSILGYGGKRPEALEVARRKYAMASVITDQAPEYFTFAVTDLASALSHVDSDPEAPTRLFRDSIKSVRARLSETHFSNLLNNAGWHFARVGLLEEAEAALTECLEIRRRAWGPTSRTAITMDNLGDCLVRLERYSEAEKLYLEAESIFRSDTSNPHYVAYPLGLLSNLYTRMGRFEEAEAKAKEALDVRMRVLGPTHEQVAMAFAMHAETLEALGKIKEARNAQAQSVELLEKYHPGDKVLLATRMTVLASYHLTLGDTAEARSVLERACKVSRETVEKKLREESPLREFLPPAP